MKLPDGFLTRPFAHRALHGPGRPENSRAAIRAAVDAGYGIEIDLQLSRDGQAMVFHDYSLERLTDETGPVRMRDAGALGAITLTGGANGIPTLSEVLNIVGGKVPLLIEFKDQDGALGPNIGPLEEAAATLLAPYDGQIAVMSFNPHSVAAMSKLLPNVPRGLTTCPFEKADWPTVSETRLADLRPLPDLERVGACFISHQADDLTNPAVLIAAERGYDVLCWTIRSAQEEAQAREDGAAQVTFEDYLA